MKHKIIKIWVSILCLFLLCPTFTNIKASTVIEVGDGITFGHYLQGLDGNGNTVLEPIHWYVLSLDGNDAYIVAKQNLDCKPYANTEESTWNSSTLRDWLANDFYYTAFTSEEREAIIDTTDRVSLLSPSDISYLNDTTVTNTNNAVIQGAYINTQTMKGYYWLQDGRYVDDSGNVCTTSALTDNIGVRPVLHLDLSKKGWYKEQAVDDTMIDAGTYGDNITWVLDKEYTLTLTGTGDMMDSTLVEYIPWHKYAAIIEKIVVEEGITSIGKNAFIDEIALVDVSLPSSLKSIGDNAFNGCTSLTQFTIPENVEVIGSTILYESSIIDLVIPSSVKELKMHAFVGCRKLETITIEGTIDIINNGFETSKNLDTVYMDSFEAYMKTFENAYNYTSNPFIFAKKLEFKDGTSLDRNMTSITIPSTVKEVGNFTFYGLDKLETVIIEEGVETLGESCFEKCTNLRSVRIPSTVKTLEKAAFRSCTSLVSVDLPASVKEIKELCFYLCTNLNDIHLHGSLDTIEYNAINKESTVTMPSLKTYIETNFTNAPDTIFNSSGKVYFEDGTYLNHDAISIQIPSDVSYIGDYTFAEFTNLEMIQFNEGLESIGKSSFKNCTNIKELHLPSTLQTIGNNAFNYASSLTEVSIPEITTWIGKDAFSHIRNLQTFSIPISCYFSDVIDEYYAEGLKKVMFTKGSGEGIDYTSECTFPWTALSNVDTIILQEGITSIGNYQLHDTHVDTIALPSTLERIGENAFYRSSISKLVIPSKVKVILADAFKNCSKLTKIFIPSTVEIIKPCFNSSLSTKIYTDADKDNPGWEENWNYHYSYALPITYNASILDVNTDLQSMTLDRDTYKYADGNEVTPEVIVKDYAGHVLEENVDYTLSYENNTNIGEAVVIATGIGQYTGTLTKSYMILSYSLEDCSVQYKTKIAYTGMPILQDVIIKDALGNALKKDVDYTIIYQQNVDVGMASMIITGINAYEGTITKQFEIVTCSLDSTSITYKDSMAYTGGAIKPTVTIKNSEGTELVEGEDYTITYANNTSVGTATMTIAGKGFYEGSIVREYEITPRLIPNTIVTFDRVYAYTGSAIEPKVKVMTMNDIVLRENVDYVLTYENNIDVGTASVIITGIGNNTGTSRYDFTITTKNLENVSYDKTTVEYTSRKIDPMIPLYDGTYVLQRGKDYVAEYTNNINIGKGTATFTGKGNYTGTKVIEFEIVPQTIEHCVIEVVGKVVYTGNPIQQEIIVRNSVGKELTLDLDYTLEYINNTSVEDSYVKVTGIGNYTGSYMQPLCIEPKTIPTDITLSATSYTYNGNAKTPTITVPGLSKDDYTVSYPSDMTSAGTKTITVTGKGNYTGFKKLTYTINKASYTPTSKAYSGAYDGKAHTITLSGVKSGSTIKYRTSPAGTWSSKKPTRTSVGKTTVYYKITNPNYKDITGSKTITIKPKATSITKLTPGSKKFTVYYTKRTTQCTGYQIRYSTSSKMTSPKTVSVTSYKTGAKTIKSLKAKKKYYVQVRTYKTVSGTKYYSAWCTKKYTTTK